MTAKEAQTTLNNEVNNRIASNNTNNSSVAQSKTATLSNTSISQQNDRTSASRNVRDLNRNQTQDQQTYETVQAILEAKKKIARTTIDNSLSGQAVSAKQLSEEIQSFTLISPKDTQSLDLALQKAQMNCNHDYNQTSNRCLYCTKHKDSHLFDTGNMVFE